MDKAKATKIREWYSKAYPTDDIVSHIREDATFWGLFDTLDNYQNVYAFIFKDGWEDSIVRERCFEHLAEIMEVHYKEIYDQWMAGA